MKEDIWYASDWKMYRGRCINIQKEVNMIRLRAIRARMGRIDYYITTASLGEVARIVSYKENPKNWPVELRKQRPLNMTRVRKEMVPYLLENPDHFYNALVLEHVRPGSTNHDIRFIADPDQPNTGWVELEGSETLEALDGQHRLKSIELAVTEMPDLAGETIALVVVPHQAMEVSQQLFSDLNRQAKTTPKSLNVVFEHREETALLAKDLAKRSRLLADKVNMAGSGLSERSPYIVTISTVYEAVKIMKPVLAGGDYEAKVGELVEYWDVALGALPGMADVVSGKIHPGQLRSKYVYCTGVGFEALAETIKAAREAFPGKWRDILTIGLARIKWELSDSQWEGVALFAGRIAIARAARRRTATLIKYLLGLPVEPEHVRELQEEVYAPLGRKLPSPLLVPTAV